MGLLAYNCSVLGHIPEGNVSIINDIWLLVPMYYRESLHYCLCIILYFD